VPADEQPGRIGDYWLSRRPNSAQWCRTWFDAGTRQTRRASLGTDNFDAARIALAQWVTLNVTLRQQHPRDVPLATVFARYYQHHGQSVRSGAINRRNLRQMLDILPEGITVDELTIPVQKAASATLHRTHAPATVARCFNIMRAAVNWAWKNGELDRPVPFISIRSNARRERVLSIAELARLWSTEMPDHVRVFLALMMGTAARPEAVLELDRAQCDVGRGIIQLNPPGRVQTKKHRPVVVMPNWLRPWIVATPQGRLVTYHGKPVKKIAGAIQTLRDAAGFGPDVTAYTIRHTIATEVRRRRVPRADVSMLLGHKAPGSNTTEVYLHDVDIELMDGVREALDDIANAIGRAATRPMEVIFSRANCVLVSDRIGTNRSEKTVGMVGATGIEPVTPTVSR